MLPGSHAGALRGRRCFSARYQSFVDRTPRRGAWRPRRSPCRRGSAGGHRPASGTPLREGGRRGEEVGGGESEFAIRNNIPRHVIDGDPALFYWSAAFAPSYEVRCLCSLFRGSLPVSLSLLFAPSPSRSLILLSSPLPSLSINRSIDRSFLSLLSLSLVPCLSLSFAPSSRLLLAPPPNPRAYLRVALQNVPHSLAELRGRP